MIIDLPLSADTHVLYQAAAKVGVRLECGSGNVVRTRSHGPRVRVEGVRLYPNGNDTYRAFSEPWTEDGTSRRKNAICFHGHREWMRAVFAVYPDAVIRSAVATHQNAVAFEAALPSLEGQVRYETCRCQILGDDGERYDIGHS